MWQALADGRIDYISSDHAPSTAEQKRAGSIWEVHFGLPGLDTTLPILLDGAAAGRISHERLVEVYSAAPARLYGLSPAKGARSRARTRTSSSSTRRRGGPFGTRTLLQGGMVALCRADPVGPGRAHLPARAADRGGRRDHGEPGRRALRPRGGGRPVGAAPNGGH